MTAGSDTDRRDEATAPDRERGHGVGRFRETIAQGLHAQFHGGRFPFAPQGRREFPLAGGEPAELRLRALAALAGGSTPRADELTGDLAAWCAANQHLLSERELVAGIGLVWSPASAEAYGREFREPLSLAPYRGMVHALARGHHCYRPIGPAHDLAGLAVLILPQVGAMSDAEISAVRSFVLGGGTLVATGETSRYDEAGTPRAEYGLADVLGVRTTGTPPDRLDAITTRVLVAPMTMRPGDIGRFKGPATDHSYLRVEAADHPILAGFAGTEVIAFGGLLANIEVDPDRDVLLSFVPPFPSYPIDKAYPDVTSTSIPGLVVGNFGAGRVIFLPADVDRRFGIDPISEHARLLDNLLSWACATAPAVRVSGAGDVLSALYRQGETLILHLVNVTGADNQSGPIEGFVPVGPITVQLRLAEWMRPSSVELRATGSRTSFTTNGETLSFQVEELVDHDLVVIA